MAKINHNNNNTTFVPIVVVRRRSGVRVCTYQNGLQRFDIQIQFFLLFLKCIYGLLPIYKRFFLGPYSSVSLRILIPHLFLTDTIIRQHHFPRLSSFFFLKFSTVCQIVKGGLGRVDFHVVQQTTVRLNGPLGPLTLMTHYFKKITWRIAGSA